MQNQRLGNQLPLAIDGVLGRYMPMNLLELVADSIDLNGSCITRPLKLQDIFTI